MTSQTFQRTLAYLLHKTWWLRPDTEGLVDVIVLITILVLMCIGHIVMDSAHSNLWRNYF